MSIRIKSTLSSLMLAAGVVSLGPVLAVDGVVLITQARAFAGNVTPGDLPGFPVTISHSGSYRFFCNLTVAGANDGFDIQVDGVTLDLNGFAIIGARGTGEGIAGTTPGVGGNNVVVTNGIVRDMGSNGIRLDSKCRIENVQAIFNGGDGINVTSGAQILSSIANDNQGDGIEFGAGCTVKDNTANQNDGDGIEGLAVAGASTPRGNTANNNGEDGIFAGAGSTVKHNTASQNGDDGIDVFAATLVLGTSATANTNYGLSLGGRVGYGHNVAAANNGGDANPQVFSGIEIDTNVCGTDTVCP